MMKMKIISDAGSQDGLSVFSNDVLTEDSPSDNKLINSNSVIQEIYNLMIKDFSTTVTLHTN